MNPELLTDAKHERQPNAEYEAFKNLPDYERMHIAASNRVIGTDTYNRTMDFLRGPEGWREQETYTLQMRRSPYGYLVAAGIEDAVEELTSRPITQAELDFAEAFYQDRNIPFFNKDMWQTIIDENEGYLPIEVHAVPDGTVLLPGEPAMRVTGPGELIAHFEHEFHRPFYDTLVATKAHEIIELVGDPARFIEVGKRGTPDEMTHLRAVKAMQIGGGFTLTSNDAAAAAFENVNPVGTIGHRYVQRFESVESAFRHAIENLDAVSLLVDLVDSYQGMKTALELKQEYRETGKKIWVRLDSGDIKEQVRFYLDECARLGFEDPDLDKIVVEGLSSKEDIAEIEAMLTDDEKKRVVYGAGGLLVAQQTARSDASTGFKMAEFEAWFGEMISSKKFSDSPGKANIPGKPTIVQNDRERVIAQVEEAKPEDDLLVPLYEYGTKIGNNTRPAAAFARCQQQYAQLETMIKNGERAKVSPQTARKIGEVMMRYGLTEE